MHMARQVVQYDCLVRQRGMVHFTMSRRREVARGKTEEAVDRTAQHWRYVASALCRASLRTFGPVFGAGSCHTANLTRVHL